MRYVIRNLAWAGAGAVLAWVAMDALREDVPRDPGGPAARAAEKPRAATRRAADAERPPDPEPAVAATSPEVEIADPAPDAAADAAPTEPTRPTVVWFPPKDSRLVYTDIPNRRADDAKGSRPATDLLDGTRITCDFGAGNNTGARVADTLIAGVGAQWQGSLMVYDLLEPSAGKARLTGTVGAAGSPTGEAKVQLMTIGSRIYFMGLQQNGTYMLTTIYDELDNMDRHVAVMSRHENGFFTYGTQWLGVCY
jgi:hypothetical protein